MIIGLCGSALCLLVFGFAKNFYVALAARLLAGAFNGYIAVIQTVVGEVVTERKHHAFGFAMIPLFWNIGCVVGPLIGRSKYLTRPQPQDVGFLLAPTSFYESFTTQYPYALSNAAVSTFLLVSALSAFLFLEETHSGFTQRYDIGLATGDSIIHFLGLKTPTRPWNIRQNTTTSPEINEATSLNAESVTSYASTLNNPEHIEVEEHIPFLAALGNREIFSHQVLLSVVAFFTIMFHTLVHVQFTPVFLGGSFQRDQLSFPWHIKGGLDWKTEDISTLLSTVGFLGCLIVLVIYPIMDRYIRTITGFRIACIMFPIAYFVVPYTIFMTPGYNPDLPSWVYETVLYSSSMIEIIGSALAFPQVTILIYRATKPKHRALVNSTVMAASAFARFMAPMIWGSLTSFFEEKGLAQIPWNLLALIGAFSVYLSFKIDDYSEDTVNRGEV
ncbi:hypothetical protein JCM33374_g1520 [Metschnikowia sp. JCM 33374]|nr:hypothetical protein JCM33374_g1520 [Metschnikowia sp. JCM 33374]